MADIVAAIDETAANVIVPSTIGSLPSVSRSGSGSLGPFGLSWSATASLTGGTVDLIPPPADVIRIAGCRLNYTLGVTLSLDLSFLNFPAAGVREAAIHRTYLHPADLRDLSDDLRASVAFELRQLHR